MKTLKTLLDRFRFRPPPMMSLRDPRYWARDNAPLPLRETTRGAKNETPPARLALLLLFVAGGKKLRLWNEKSTRARARARRDCFRAVRRLSLSLGSSLPRYLDPACVRNRIAVVIQTAQETGDGRNALDGTYKSFVSSSSAMHISLGCTRTSSDLSLSLSRVLCLFSST